MERYSVHSMKRLSTKGTCPQVHSIGCISFTLCSFALLLFTSHLLSFYLALFDVWEQSSLIYWGAPWSSARARVMGVNWSLCYLSINFVAPFHRAVVGWSHSFFFYRFQYCMWWLPRVTRAARAPFPRPTYWFRSTHAYFPLNLFTADVFHIKRCATSSVLDLCPLKK